MHLCIPPIAPTPGVPHRPRSGTSPIRQPPELSAWGAQDSRGGRWSRGDSGHMWVALIPSRRWLGSDPTAAWGHPVPHRAGPQPAAPPAPGNPPAAGTGTGTVPAGTRRASLPGPAPAGGTPSGGDSVLWRHPRVPLASSTCAPPRGSLRMRGAGGSRMPPIPQRLPRAALSTPDSPRPQLWHRINATAVNEF